MFTSGPTWIRLEFFNGERILPYRTSLKAKAQKNLPALLMVH